MEFCQQYYSNNVFLCKKKQSKYVLHCKWQIPNADDAEIFKIYKCKQPRNERERERERSWFTFCLSFLSRRLKLCSQDNRKICCTQMCLLISCPTFVTRLSWKQGDEGGAGGGSEGCLVIYVQGKRTASVLRFDQRQGKYFPLCDKVPPTSLSSSPARSLSVSSFDSSSKMAFIYNISIKCSIQY